MPMEGSHEADLQDVDSVTRQLNEELRSLIHGKWHNDRRLFKVKKRVVISLLKNLMQDVKSITYR